MGYTGAMRDTLTIIGVVFVASVIGVPFFLYGPNDFPNMPTQAVTKTAPPARLVPFREIARGSHSTETRRVNYLITSRADLAQLWKMLDATGTPPEVDFTTRAIIAVFAGTQSESGCRIAVSRIEDTEVRTVIVALTKPGINCAPSQSVTAPYAIVELPKTPLTLTHRDVLLRRSC